MSLSGLKRLSPPSAADASNSDAQGAKAARSEHEDAALRGVLALAKKSGKRRYVLFGPHDFGGVRVECAMFDTGCNAHLLPLPEPGSLSDLWSKFPTPSYRWTLDAVDGAPLVLVVMHPQAFHVRFSPEMLPHATGVELAQLRFYLCADDLRALTRMKVLSSTMQAMAEARAVTAVQDAYPTGRRKHALIGQDILQRRATLFIQHGNMAALLDPTFPLTRSHIEELRDFARAKRMLLPEAWPSPEDIHVGDSSDPGGASDVEEVLVG